MAGQPFSTLEQAWRVEVEVFFNGAHCLLYKKTNASYSSPAWLGKLEGGMGGMGAPQMHVPMGTRMS